MFPLLLTQAKRKREATSHDGESADDSAGGSVAPRGAGEVDVVARVPYRIRSLDSEEFVRTAGGDKFYFDELTKSKRNRMQAILVRMLTHSECFEAFDRVLLCAQATVGSKRREKKKSKKRRGKRTRESDAVDVDQANDSDDDIDERKRARRRTKDTLNARVTRRRHRISNSVETLRSVRSKDVLDGIVSRKRPLVELDPMGIV